LDWRDRGAVTQVRDQGECGSSPLFGIIGTIEATHVVYEGFPLTNLSIQQILDCCPDTNQTDICNGCGGSNYDPLFHYAIQYGTETEDDYPYTATDNTCKYDSTKVVARISDYGSIDQGDEDEFTRVLAENSPVALAIDASQSSFMFYSGGIYSDPKCTTNIDHGIMAIGYGVDNNIPYYILKNTYGPNWGEKGYIRIIRNGQNMCGVAKFCYYPIV